ncbi:MAG: glycosyltransferase family 8 protein [Thermoguttaceae bacterium]|nr:glycosyltransferase family 8 protein [Thermoguttaceae bacterium]
MTDTTNVKKTDPIEVMLVCDENYGAFMATTMASILKNAAEDDSLRFHIVDCGLGNASLEAVEELKKLRPFDVVYYQHKLPDYVYSIKTPFPAVVYHRLFAPTFLPESLDKILYLDVDIAVLASLRELWDASLDGVFAAAVTDRRIDEEHCRSIGIENKADYFNAGVLLMNLKKWREDDVVARLFEIIQEFEGRLFYADQDVLNIYASRYGLHLVSGDWNTNPLDYVEGQTRLLHYMGSRRHSPHLDVLFNYASLTTFRRLPMQRASFKIKRAICKFLCLFLFRRKDRQFLRELMKVNVR